EAGNSPTRVATEGEQAALRQTAIQMNDPIARTSAAVIRYDGHRSSWRRSHERPDGRVQGLIDPRDRIREGSRDVPRRARIVEAPEVMRHGVGGTVDDHERVPGLAREQRSGEVRPAGDAVEQALESPRMPPRSGVELLEVAERQPAHQLPELG